MAGEKDGPGDPGAASEGRRTRQPGNRPLARGRDCTGGRREAGDRGRPGPVRPAGMGCGVAMVHGRIRSAR
ncbi:hypothetical protein JCM13210_22990 [Thermaerobacter litoralis]